MMNPQVKQAWVLALTSGEYAQTRDRLQREGIDGRKSFCCLGVLREVTDPQRLIHERDDVDHGDETQFGLSQGLTQKQLDGLMTLNDDEKLSFPAIAQVIAAFL